MQRKESATWRTGHGKSPSQRSNTRKKGKREKKAYGNYGIQRKETIFTLWKFQKEKRKRKEQKVYLKQ